MRLPRERPRNLDLLALLGVSISGSSVRENEGPEQIVFAL